MKTMKLAIIALLTVHGLIHAIGFAGTWGLAEFGEPSRVPTNIVTAHPDDPIVRVLGFVWLLALIGFMRYEITDYRLVTEDTRRPL